MSLPSHKELEDFLFEEARLLDDREFERWSELFLDDGYYWMPAKPNQANPYDHVSLFYDNKETMETRIRRLRHPLVHVQIPHSTSLHLISNVTLGVPERADEITLRSNFIMFEDRPPEERRIFAGRTTHRLRQLNGRLGIVLKRVDLTNSTTSFPALSLFI